MNITHAAREKVADGRYAINATVACATKRPKQVQIDIEAYIEDYVLENYFRLHTLLPFQLKGTLYLCSSSL
jgi:hypothetical protein